MDRLTYLKETLKINAKRMRENKFASIISVVCLTAIIGAGQQYYGVDEPIMGIYEGDWNLAANKGKLISQIRALGDNQYDGFVLLKQGEADFAVIKVKSQKDVEKAIVIKGSTAGGNSPKIDLVAKISDGKMGGTISSGNDSSEFNAKKAVKKSPTLGQKPPPGAVVLFDGKDTNKFKNFRWKLVEGDAMEVTRGDVFFKGDYKNFKLHIEFRTPFMPKALGQARGNSGVYLWSMYEVQVLDSFGIYPLADNDCGSIYSVKAAKGNNCLPPMEWQTYDIIYHDGDGTPNNPPTITVYHNGELTLENVKIPPSMIGKGGAAATPGGGLLKLQDHGNPVQYRNIWLLPLKE